MPVDSSQRINLVVCKEIIKQEESAFIQIPQPYWVGRAKPIRGFRFGFKALASESLEIGLVRNNTPSSMEYL